MFGNLKVEDYVNLKLNLSNFGSRLLVGFSFTPVVPIASTMYEPMVVDTGSPLTVFPQRIWKPLLQSDMLVDMGPTTVRGIGGPVIEARLYQIESIWLFHPVHRGKPKRIDNVVAKCPMSDDMQPLLGLGGAALSCGGLCINVADNDAHLVFVK